MTFHDRTDAGRRLARALAAWRDRPGAVVLGIPRGGVVVASEIALALRLPLDLWFAHKLGAPGNPEFAIGSVAGNGDVQLDDQLAAALGADASYLRTEIAQQKLEVERRMRLYRGDRPPLMLENRTVLVADDGLATGSTALAALKSVRAQRPARLILAVPVAPPDAKAHLTSHADELVVLHLDTDFRAVGQYYEQFTQVTDDEVIALLRQADARLAR